ncbi:MAG: CsgG/HfaB family protein [Thermodesulfovibrio sp.]|nr:CsgG/HfaB family protein [Thermodesulfovibrio sp.]
MGKKIFKIIILCFISISCVPPKINMSDYTATPEIDSKTVKHPLPDYVINKKKPKVAVLPPSDNPRYSQCKLYNTAQEYLVQALANTGTVELVERSQLNVIMQEIKFKAGITGEIDVEKFSKIAHEVDFVIVGSIPSASTTTQFTEGSSWTDKKGKTHYIPASCKEEAKVNLLFRVITFPSGNIQKALNMSGQKSIKRDVQSSFDCRVQDLCGLLGQAIDVAINNSIEELMQAFPVYGYIYKTMTNIKNPKERLAFVNLGSADGIKAGSELEIIEFVKDIDPIKMESIITPQIVGECVVSETNLQPDRSICIISENFADKVFTGHAVKLKVTETFGRKLQKFFR